MQDSTAIARMEWVYRTLEEVMDERARRQWAAAEAKAYGWGGVSAVSTASGMSPNTIRRGLNELAEREANPGAKVSPRIRQEGGGRKKQTEVDPELLEALEQLIDPVTRGDPQSPLRWTCKSTLELASELTRQRHPVSASTVWRLLDVAGYSMQSNRKTKEGAQHPDRNTQFEHINQTVKAFQQRGQPVISVDTKKKELIGEFRNVGREWQPKGEPVEVLIHDFMDKELGKAIPYGVYDVTQNQGWVSVGIDHDTARFATEAIRRWWQNMGRRSYPGARELLITADGGGSNGRRTPRNGLKNAFTPRQKAGFVPRYWLRTRRLTTTRSAVARGKSHFVARRSRSADCDVAKAALVIFRTNDLQVMSLNPTPDRFSASGNQFLKAPRSFMRKSLVICD